MSVHPRSDEQPVRGASCAPSLKLYCISVEGFDSHYVRAESMAKARYKDFLAYDEAGYGRSMHDHCSKHERFVNYSRRLGYCFRVAERDHGVVAASAEGLTREESH